MTIELNEQQVALLKALLEDIGDMYSNTTQAVAMQIISKLN